MVGSQEKTKAAAAYFTQNRVALEKLLGHDYLAVLTSGRAPHRTADENYPFWADRNYFYLAGLEQEECILLLYDQGGRKEQVLFLDKQDPFFERWRGHRADFAEARAISGLTQIKLKDELESYLGSLNRPETVWLDQSRQDSYSGTVKEMLAGLLPGQVAESQDLAPLLARLRMIKGDYELDRMAAAITLTAEGLQAVLDRLEPGLMEYQLWGAFAGALAEKGCLSPAFPSIVASGKNIFCLHYMTPFDQIRPGDLVQLDVGAIVDGLCADISRVYPASGRFSPQQRIVYEIVRQCQETAFSFIKPGVTLAGINAACRQTAAAGLLRAGLIADKEAVGEHFWHSVSHHLGLDVHDISDREASLQPGMVLTVEPGLYLPQLNIGMRIEDDVLVTEDGCKNLSQAIIREAEEIEELMAARRM